MLVYGDSVERAAIGDRIAAARALLRSANAGRGISAHADMVAAFIIVAELAQACIDDAEEAGPNARAVTLRTVASDLVLAAAARVADSWSGVTPSREIAFSRLLNVLGETEALAFRRAEGYAHYALYPECYLEASKVLRGRRPQVVGIRSIGLGLGAIVAQGSGAETFVSVRPTGHPFDRRVELPDGIGAAQPQPIAIVDEGPGLSGSSFGSVLDVLEARGVAPARLHMFPSHCGEPGPEASERSRGRWRSLSRHVRSFDDVFVAGTRYPFASWFADLGLGRLEDVRDVSGGAWREALATEDREAPVYPGLERRKFVLKAETGVYLVKFAGLDGQGRAKADLARRLAEASMTPGFIGYRHGFTVELWLSGSRPAKPSSLGRAAVVARLADYIAHRARHCAAIGPGASPEDLRHMAMFNVEAALGSAVALRLRPMLDRASRLGATWRPVSTDNRLHMFEWRVQNERLLKTDAVDHCAAHDLVGCQDIAWDVAGALVEWSLSDAEAGALLEHLDRAGVRTESYAIGFCVAAYCAFQLALWTFAQRSQTPVPQALRRLCDKYRAMLHRLADGSTGACWAGTG